MTINEKSYAYGAAKSSIREIAAYGAARKAAIGAENVYDFSLGNPSIPAREAELGTKIYLVDRKSTR